MKRISYHGLGLDCTFEPYDPGVHTYPNGDPGYPPSGGCLESVDEVEIDDSDEVAEHFEDGAPGLRVVWPGHATSGDCPPPEVAVTDQAALCAHLLEAHAEKIEELRETR